MPRSISTVLQITESEEGVQIEVKANFDLENALFRDTAARTLAYIAYKAVSEEMDRRREDGEFGEIHLSGHPTTLANLGENDNPVI